MAKKQNKPLRVSITFDQLENIYEQCNAVEDINVDEGETIWLYIDKNKRVERAEMIYRATTEVQIDIDLD
jgi:hypothetical protein